MNFPTKKASVVVSIASAALLAGCATLGLGEPDERWADYKTWTKITGDNPTGDPSGLLGVVHKGPDGWRNVYVNDIAKEASEGTAPYQYPEGSVIVKEQYANQADWEADKNGEVTVSVKAADDGTVNKDNWIWAAGYKGKAGASAFCSGCHSAANAIFKGDFVFTSADFLAKHGG